MEYNFIKFKIKICVTVENIHTNNNLMNYQIFLIIKIIRLLI